MDTAVPYYNPSSQSEIHEAAFHHMETVQVNSLNIQEDKRYIWLVWESTQPDAQAQQFDC